MQTRAPRPVEPPQRPVPGDALGPRRGEGDAVDGVVREAPGRKRLPRVLAVSHGVGHGAMLLPVRRPPVVDEKLS